MKKLFLLGVNLMALSLASPVLADSLRDYTKQKHADRNRKKVTDEDCPTEYVNRCRGGCSPSDTACVQRCRDEAPKFCSERDSRQAAKAAGLFAKGFSLGAGGFGMLFDDKMPEVMLDENGKSTISPYAIIWNKSSFVGEVSGALMEAGAFGVGATASYRHGHFGFGGQAVYFWDNQNTTLLEADFGPTFSFATANILVGLQPSLVVSKANGDPDTLFGPGLRTRNMFIIDRGFISFDPMLYYMNSQWGYHLRAGYGYRITPEFFANLSYEYRDILDFNTLDVENAAFQGVFVYAGYRFN
jgi:opacity protein-like surface antigen